MTSRVCRANCASRSKTAFRDTSEETMNIGEAIREISVEPTELPLPEPAMNVPMKEADDERQFHSSPD